VWVDEEKLQSIIACWHELDSLLLLLLDSLARHSRLSRNAGGFRVEKCFFAELREVSHIKKASCFLCFLPSIQPRKM